MHYLERLKLLREDRNLKQETLGSILGVTQGTYSRWENGDRDITIPTMLTLAEFYDVSMDYITGASDTRKPFPKG